MDDLLIYGWMEDGLMMDDIMMDDIMMDEWMVGFKYAWMDDG